MTFLQPFILWGLPLLLIPVIIHLLNRLRHRPQPWAAMRFLRAANQTSISQAKLRQFLVLLFRVLAIIALILFLSRPLAGGWLGWALSPAPEAIILILDRSASMEAVGGNGGKSLREQAIELWTDALKTFGSSSRLVLLDSATQIPQEIPSINSLAQVQFTGPTDTAADIPGLLQRAYNYLSESRSGASEIWIASDLQESNWSPEDAQWERIQAQFAALKQKVRFRLLTFEESAVRNVSVSLVDAVRRSRGDTRTLNVVIDLEQSNVTPEPIALQWSIGGSSSQTELTISGQSLRWRNNFPLPRATSTNESGWGTIEIGADGNGADNRLYFAYGAETRPVAVVVSSGSSAATRPLQLATSDLGRPTEEWTQVVTPDSFSGVPLTNVALVVWFANSLPGAAQALLEDFVNSGGALVIFPFPGSSFEFAGMSFGQVSSAPVEQPFAIGQWSDLEGPLAKTEEGFGVPLKSLEVTQRAAISASGGVLAEFEDGLPFLVRKALGRGEVYLCATSADPDWSSLSDGSVLVPMLQRMLATGGRRVNRAVMTESSDLAGQDLDEWERMDASTAPSNPLLHAGIYKVDGKFIAVNRPAAENNLSRLTSDGARLLFQNLPFRLHEERGTGTDRLQGEIWRAFVTLMLIFLVAEGLLILPSTGERQPSSRRQPTGRTEPAEVAA
jgi:hypothetical protein